MDRLRAASHRRRQLGGKDNVLAGFLEHFAHVDQLGLRERPSAGLYGALAVVDFVLMRRYARLDPPEVGGDVEGAAPALGY